MSVKTAESVTEGHPDKIADQISDAIVDAVIEKDSKADVSCETLISNGFCIIAGEMKTEAYAPISEIARNAIREIGYTDGAFGFDYRSAGVITAVNERSPDIAEGKRVNGKLGASDQSIVVGYACRETPEFMPLPIALAHRLTLRLARARKEGVLPFLLPDGKAQIAIRYENNRPIAIEHILISTHHARNAALKDLREAVMEEVVKEALPKSLFDEKTRVEINPAGSFVIGGPQADTGLTGRKSASDFYGTRVAFGGGALSGKDPAKIDRCGAYMARYIAKNLAAALDCDQVSVYLTYAIGSPEPIAVEIYRDRSPESDEKLIKLAKEIFDLTPEGIVSALDLLKPQYRALASYGHFGRENEGFGWEKLDKIDAIRSKL
ncbi:MAG: methionine adenosyltransferase [Helicobacteraceae bacterium]|jgi:S-adenosylmethionine synthetase|nr:methionine adenosyltransferase [Helicobacteraceae bacterium]